MTEEQKADVTVETLAESDHIKEEKEEHDKEVEQMEAAEDELESIKE